MVTVGPLPVIVTVTLPTGAVDGDGDALIDDDGD